MSAPVKYTPIQQTVYAHGWRDAVKEVKERLTEFYLKSDSSPDVHPGVYAILDAVLESSRV